MIYLYAVTKRTTFDLIKDVVIEGNGEVRLKEKSIQEEFIVVPTGIIAQSKKQARDIIISTLPKDIQDILFDRKINLNKEVDIIIVPFE